MAKENGFFRERQIVRDISREGEKEREGGEGREGESIRRIDEIPTYRLKDLTLRCLFSLPILH